MRITILTTDTPHHAYFVRELASAYADVNVVCESPRLPSPPFETSHPFEAERDDYEWQTWFSGRPTPLDALAPTIVVHSVNDRTALGAITEHSPDVVIAFGTGIIKAPLIAQRPGRLLNLHGGDPEQYRGLDTHLWAIYHRDFAGLVTTLHRIDAGIDTGDIVLQGVIPVAEGMPIHQLRRANTEVCVALATSAVDMICRADAVVSRPQRTKGRYYSAMPAVLKELCRARFAAHTGVRLP